MPSTITLGTNSYTLIAMPSTPGFTDISVSMIDAVAVVPSPYVPSQVQTQTWPGADGWAAQVTLPKMPRNVASSWIAFLAALRGKQNVFELGDPLGAKPCGVAKGTPVVDGTISGGNAVNATTLCTKGWTAGVYRQLLAGDYLQIGNRLYMACAEVDSDGSGKAQFGIWPCLRETPEDGAAIKLINCQGVFRLATNKRDWHMTKDRNIQISFPLSEVR